MSDVRLTATNPDDSSVIPVACNARGELLTVAPVIEKIPNDVEIEGDLTVTGTINGDSGGSGLPAPGPEGSILAIENGAPAWVGKSDLCAPDPSIDRVIFKPDPNAETPAIAISQFGTEMDWITDNNAHMRSLPSWDDPGSQYPMGFGKVGRTRTGFTVECEKTFGMVLHITIDFMLASGASDLNPGFPAYVRCETSSPNVQVIRDSHSINPGTGKTHHTTNQFSYLIVRDDMSIDFLAWQEAFGIGNYENSFCCIQHFSLEDSESFLMRNYFQQQQKIDEIQKQLLARQGEVGSTTDIDL